MPISTSEIEALIKTAMPEARVDVSGDGVHFAASIEAAEFEGLNSFSSKVAGVLNYLDINFQDVNVLEDEEIRQGIKDYSEWPTIPQLYIKGEFIGGCDIITEMVLSSEFDQLLNDKEINFSASKANEVRDANS